MKVSDAASVKDILQYTSPERECQIRTGVRCLLIE
jgi:hypothetical protein